MSFVDEKRVLGNSQYGFRKNMSTSLVILELIEAISTSTDMGEITVGVFIDLKKAFDTVDHAILVNKLQRYGIRGLANKMVV